MVRRLSIVLALLASACAVESAEEGRRAGGKADSLGSICTSITGECSTSVKPYVCDGPIPSYDCERCGCPGAQTCFEGVCYDPQVPSLESTTPTSGLNFPIEDYFELLDGLAGSPAIGYGDFIDALDLSMTGDPRFNSVLLGESHGSKDEQAVGLAIIRDLIGLGWNISQVGIEGETPLIDLAPLADLGVVGHTFGGDLTNDAHCDDLVDAIEGGTNDESVYVLYSGSGHLTQEICHHPTYWPVCNLPHTAECATRAGRRAPVVILFDIDIWMWKTDRLLLWSLPGVENRDEFEAAIAANMTRWQQSFDAQVLDPAFDTTVEGRPVNVRFVQATHADDVYIAFFPRPDRKPYFNAAYYALWSEPALQDYIVEHDLGPKRCATSWDLSEASPTFTFLCSNDGHELRAVVHGQTFEVLESEIVEE